MTETLRFPLAHRYKSIDISRAFFDVDYIINMPKLKTHGFAHYTGAVKNLFGAMPGLSKSRDAHEGAVSDGILRVSARPLRRLAEWF